jgi:hypothetical protein
MLKHERLFRRRARRFLLGCTASMATMAGGFGLGAAMKDPLLDPTGAICTLAGGLGGLAWIVVLATFAGEKES